MPAAAPRLAHDLGVDPGRSAGVLLAAFYGLALVIEPWLLRKSETARVRRWLAVALALLAAITLAIGLAPSYLALLVAVSLYGPASGAATAVAEGALVEAAPEARERTMARIVFAAGLGDLLVPAVLWGLDRVARGWRDAQVLAAALALVLAALVASSRALDRPLAQGDVGDDERPGLRDALRNRALVAWSFADALTGIMDEVVVAFVAVHVHAQVSADAGDVALAVLGWISGGMLGLAALDRALARIAPMRVLATTAALSLAPLALLVVARDLATACAALFVLGALASTFHPIVKARCYASMPGHPGLVGAVGSMLVPVDLVAPLALAAVAEHAGTAVAIALLGLVPLALLPFALRSR